MPEKGASGLGGVAVAAAAVAAAGGLAYAVHTITCRPKYKNLQEVPLDVLCKELQKRIDK